MNKKNLIFAIIIVAIVLILVLVISLSTKTDQTEVTGEQANNVTSEVPSQNIINENQPVGQPAQGLGNETAPVVENATGAVAAIPAQNIVPASLGVPTGTKGAPKQEAVEVEKIPLGSIKIEVSDQGFKPQEFTVNAGQPISLAITSTDQNLHVMTFARGDLAGLTTVLQPGETKILNFSAPGAGSFSFRDGTIVKNTGTMIVK